MGYYALVYADYESLDLLALGDEDFVKTEYERIKNEIQNLNDKFNVNNDSKSWELPNEYYESDYCNKEVDRLCIQGYKEGNIKCLCGQFGIEPTERIYY